MDTTTSRALYPGQAGISMRAATWIIALTAGLVYLLFGFAKLEQPPVWDGAMGMTPAALTLEALDFDVGHLLTLPDYREGGPNLHSLSVVTWFVAGMIRFFGGYQAALPYLHILSFGLAGLLVGGVYQAVIKLTVNRPLALTTAVVSGLFPPIIVQAHDVYLDLPLAVAVTWSFVALFDSRLGITVGLATLAAAIKPTALIVIPPMLIYLLMTRKSRPWSVTLLALPVLAATFPWVIDAALRPRTEPSVDGALGVFAASLFYLRRMPVMFGVLLLLLVAGVWVYAISRSSNSNSNLVAMPIVITSLALPISFFYFFLLNPFLSKGVVALPRYTTIFMPLVLIGLASAFRALFSNGVATLVIAVIGLVFVLNLHGDLEPSSLNAFWIAERSLAYEDMLTVQKESFEYFALQARELPSYYDHFTHYRIEYPETGWLAHPLPKGTPVNLEPSLSGEDLAELPDKFVMLIEGSFGGSAQLIDIRDSALDHPHYEVEISQFRHGEFGSQVVVVKRQGR